MTVTGPAPSRADARRNRALVLQAAQVAFEEEGLGVPIGEIARRAGVGAGTVHRHFPSKEALFRAAVADRVRLFVDTARELADVDDPGGVFFRYLSSVVRLTARNRALCEALEASGTGGFAPSPAMEREFGEALGVLLRRAQEAGAVRKDVLVTDVRTLLIGCVSMERRRPLPLGSPSEARANASDGEGGASPAIGVPGRMTALMCDGLRPGRGVTKLPDRTPIRNETRCGVCGEPVPPARTGRPARYCGGSCRQKAHRTRAQARARARARGSA
ncbi:TetR/AcrR family transcriptional regulator [Streptomyces sp. NPDC003077]|uniref:TetR/AcrR family transcriptional regulator n=1 Tax=Streptomyces sp. NPDC003077 TaxID=3154443 RepID=UPI0033B981B2